MAAIIEDRADLDFDSTDWTPSEQIPEELFYLEDFINLFQNFPSPTDSYHRPKMR